MKMCMVRKTKVFMYGLEARIFLHEYDHMEGRTLQMVYLN